VCWRYETCLPSSPGSGAGGCENSGGEGGQWGPHGCGWEEDEKLESGETVYLHYLPLLVPGSLFNLFQVFLQYCFGQILSMGLPLVNTQLWKGWDGGLGSAGCLQNEM